MLAAGFEKDPDCTSLDGELRNLASTLGEWPLLLKLANGAGNFTFNYSGGSTIG